MAVGVIQKVVFSVVDDDGTPGTFSLDKTANAAADPITSFAAMAALFNAVSDCKIVGQVGQTADNSESGAVESNLYDARDKLEIGYVGSQNDHHVMHIGDLDPLILGPDGEAVDPEDVDWEALKDAIEGNVVDKLGAAVTVTYAKRTRSRNLKRKLNPEITA